MIPMGEEVKCHLSLFDRNHIHEGFRMEASQNFIFSHFSSIGVFCTEGRGADAPCELGKGIGNG